MRLGYSLIAVLAVVSANCTSKSERVSDPPVERGAVFVLGGIHQQHERARLYTYQRVGDVYSHLRPDVLCVEAQQQYLDDKSDRGIPRDFTTEMLPRARRDGIPIVGIDWWDDVRGKEWEELQGRAASDPSLQAGVKLLGTMFDSLNDYFAEVDFREANSPAIVSIWSGKTALKERIARSRPEYAPIAEFEAERNRRMADAVATTAARHPKARVLVAVGFDHKPYLDKELPRRGLRVVDVDEAVGSWWRP